MGPSERVLRADREEVCGRESGGEAIASPPTLGGESTGAGLVGQGEAQGESVGCRGDGEGVGAHEWHIARPLVVGLEGDEATQLVLGILSQVHTGWDHVIWKYVIFVVTKPSLSDLVSVLPDVVGCEGEGIIW